MLFPPIRGWEGKMNMDNLIDAQEGAPAQKFEPLEDGATYRVRFPDFDGPGKDAFEDLLHCQRRWITGCEAYVEGPLKVEEAGYEVVAKVERAADASAEIKPADDGASRQKFDPLENRTIYRVRFRDFNGPGKDEFMDILHDCGFWSSPDRGDGDMGPIRVEDAEYEVVARVGRQKPARRIGPAPCLFIQQKLLRWQLRQKWDVRPSATPPVWQRRRGEPKPT